MDSVKRAAYTHIGEGDWRGCKLDVYNPFRVFEPFDSKDVVRPNCLFTGFQFVLDLTEEKANQLRGIHIEVNLIPRSTAVADRPYFIELYPEAPKGPSSAEAPPTPGGTRSRRAERMGERLTATTKSRTNSKKKYPIAGPNTPPLFWDNFDPKSLTISTSGIDTKKATWTILLPKVAKNQPFPRFLPISLVVMHWSDFVGNIEIQGKSRKGLTFTAIKTKSPLEGSDGMIINFDSKGWAMDVTNTPRSPR